MGNFRRPVSRRRFIKNRKVPMSKRITRSGRVTGNAISIDTAGRGSNPSNVLVHRGIGFPDRFNTNLAYTESFVLTSFGSSITQRKTFRLNGLFDPDESLGGGQPTYFDQFALLYNKYIVKGAKVSCTFSQTTTVGVGEGPFIVGIQSSSSPSLPSTDAPTLTMSPNTSYSFVSQTGDVKTVTHTFSSKALSISGTDDNTASNTNNLPGIQWYANVFASPQGSSVAGAVVCLVTINYNVDFYSLKPVIDT